MKKIFLQDWGPFFTDTLVVVGMDNKEIVQWLKKHANEPHMHAAIKDFEDIGRPVRGKEVADAFVYTFDGKTILWLGWDWKGSLFNLGNLVHETHHLVFNMAKNKGMADEDESQSYLQEWLFGEISRKLGVKSKRRGKRHDRRTSQGKSH